MPQLPDATLRFLDAVAALKLDLTVEPQVFPEGTRTSADAARAVGCDLGAIAKSLVFMVGEEPTLVLMSGDRRVSVHKLASLLGAAGARRATLEEARACTGYAAGGTPALGLATAVRVVADESLRRNETVWSAAGTPTTVYPIRLQDLVDASGATWADVAESG